VEATLTAIPTLRLDLLTAKTHARLWASLAATGRMYTIRYSFGRERPQSDLGDMGITIAGITFDHHRYDARGDVLYLNVGQARCAARSLEIEGGHAIHYNEAGAVSGLTLLSVRRTINRDSHLDLVLPLPRIIHSDALRAVLGGD
jgi:uncharacterized protein YuzE